MPTTQPSDVISTLSPAIVPFLGVVLGAFISVYGSFYVAVWRQRRSDFKRLVADSKHDKKVCRILYINFCQVIDDCDSSLKENKWMFYDSLKTASRDLRRFRSILITNLSLDQFLTAQKAFHALNQFLVLEQLYETHTGKIYFNVALLPDYLSMIERRKPDIQNLLDIVDNSIDLPTPEHKYSRCCGLLGKIYQEIRLANKM